MRILFSEVPILVGVQATAGLKIGEQGPELRVEDAAHGQALHLIFTEDAELISMASGLLQGILAHRQAVLEQKKHGVLPNVRPLQPTEPRLR